MWVSLFVPSVHDIYLQSTESGAARMSRSRSPLRRDTPKPLVVIVRPFCVLKRVFGAFSGLWAADTTDMQALAGSYMIKWDTRHTHTGRGAVHVFYKPSRFGVCLRSVVLPDRQFQNHACSSGRARSRPAIAVLGLITRPST